MSSKAILNIILSVGYLFALSGKKKTQTNLFCVERSHQITRNRSVIYAINTEIVFFRCNIYFSALSRHVYCFSCTAQTFLVKGVLKGHYFCVSYSNWYYCKILHKCAGIVLYSITYLSFEIKVWFQSPQCCYFKDLVFYMCSVCILTAIFL